MKNRSASVFNIAVFVAALGYFVDIYDLLLFTIVKKPSINALHVIGGDAELFASTRIINLQMYGLLIGGIIWGVLGDKKGRLSVLFGSIILYSIANIFTGYCQTIDQYAWARFVAGLGLAGELGAGITLVSELLPKNKRGIGTSLVAGLGLSGAVLAYFVFHFTQNWRTCYFIGGGLGFLLLILRISVAESGMFTNVKQQNIVRGNFLMFFTNFTRFKKYLKAILIGLPTWFCVGILINQSDRFASALHQITKIDSGKSIMFSYIGVSIGGIVIGMLSQWMKSRKKPLYIFYFLTTLSVILFLTPSVNNNDTAMYWLCGALGFATGFWAIFVTMGAEQFGTNLRATAATTIPNMVRGSLPLLNMLFKDLFYVSWKWSLVKSAAYTGAIVLVVTLVAAFFTEDTFHKDLNFVEQ